MKSFIDKLSAHIQSEYNLTGETVHKGKKGTDREQLIKEAIKNLLPDMFLYGDGEIIDAKSNRSGQQDLIIYSRFMSILKAAQLKQFPSDSVCGAVAIKSIINKTFLKKDFINIRGVKCLELSIRPPILIGTWKKQIPCFIFGFDGDSIITMKKNIEEFKTKLKLKDEEMFDSLCILDKYIITNNPLLKAHFGYTSGEQYAYLELKKNSFLYFLDIILNGINIPLAPKPIFAKYMGSLTVKCIH